MDRKLRMGVIGLGVGRGHVKNFRDHPGAEVVAVCDTNESRVQAVAGEFGVAGRYTDAQQMFDREKLDAVSIATPNKFHAPLAINALNHGLHVLCEKPMAMNTAEALAMKAAAEKAGKNLMINFSYRYNEMSQSLKHQVKTGVLGDIYYGRSVWHRRRGIPGFGGWFCDKELAGGGPLIDLCVHRLDLALWLMDFPTPVAVSGATFNRLGTERAAREGKTFTVEDLAVGLVRFANGAVLVVEASWALNIGEPEHMVTTLCGTRGGLVQKNTDGGYSFAGEIYTEEDGFMYTRKLDKGSRPVPPSHHEFVNSILEKRQPDATADQGIMVMRILDALYGSAAQKKEVTVTR